MIAEGPGRGGASPLLLVHHGLFWDGNVPIAGRRYRRVAALLEHDVAGLSAHIPLDLHPAVGNNIVLAERLGLAVRGLVRRLQGRADRRLGACASRLVPRDALLAECEPRAWHLSPGARLIAGGPDRVARVGIITGGAGNMIGAAHDAGLDTFITGEGAHYTYFDAIEWGLNVMFAGHYATETLGVQALASHLAERFDLGVGIPRPPDGLVTAPPVLVLRGIRKRFGSVQALRGADFTLMPGQLHALLGENGAGKTTLMQVAYGLVRPDAGEIAIEGWPRTIGSPRVARRFGSGWCTSISPRCRP